MLTLLLLASWPDATRMLYIFICLLCLRRQHARFIKNLNSHYAHRSKISHQYFLQKVIGH